MTPSEYLPLAIAAALGAGVPVRAVRFQNAVEASGPSVLWRNSETTYTSTLDTLRGGLTSTFEIECRAPTWAGAIQIAEDITERLQRDGSLNRILDDGDDRDTASGERGGYFAHVLEVELQR